MLQVVGHVPSWISLICSTFIRRGGIIKCTVTVWTLAFSFQLPSVAQHYSKQLLGSGSSSSCIVGAHLKFFKIDIGLFQYKRNQNFCHVRLFKTPKIWLGLIWWIHGHSPNSPTFPPAKVSLYTVLHMYASYYLAIQSFCPNLTQVSEYLESVKLIDMIDVKTITDVS